MFIQLVLSVLLINVIDVVTHDPQLSQSGIVFTLFDCFLECVAHNGDQHVQESDLNHESRDQEKQVDEHLLIARCPKSIKLELAEAQLILILEGIKDPETADVRNELG